MSPAPSGARRVGRRPGAPDTRGQILSAARDEFASRGYDAATIRGIAARARVDAALVHHYFGSKEQVFTAAMQLPVEPAALAASVVDGPFDAIGERAVRAFLGIWGNPTSRAPFLLLLRSAMTHEAAAAMLRQFVRHALLARVVAALELDDRELRVELAAASMVGTALLRYVVRLEPLASSTEEEVVALLAPTVQRYLAG